MRKLVILLLCLALGVALLIACESRVRVVSTRQRLLAAARLIPRSATLRLWTQKPETSADPDLTNVPGAYEISADDEAVYGLEHASLSAPYILWMLRHGDSKPKELFRAAGFSRSPMPIGPSVYLAVDNRVMRIPKNGGAPTQIAQFRWPISFIVTDGTKLYLSVGDTRRAYAGGAPPVHPGALLSVPIAGGALTQLAEHTSGRPLMALDASRLYFATDGGVAAVEKAGGPVQSVITTHDPSESPSALAAAGDCVYTLVQGELRQVDKRTAHTRVLYKATILLDLTVHNGWVYVLRNTAYLGPGIHPEPGALVAVSLTDHTVRTLAEPLKRPLKIAASKQGLFVLEADIGSELVALRKFTPLAPQ